MGLQSKMHDMGGRFNSVLCVVPALLIACLVPVFAADARAINDPDAPVQGQRHHGRNSLEERVKGMTKWLDLDAKQQVDLKKVLEGQRDEVLRVWNDTSVPPAYRISATQAISDKTADQIRALLNEEQRKKYNPPKQKREAEAGDGKSVESWMGAAKPR